MAVLVHCHGTAFAKVDSTASLTPETEDEEIKAGIIKGIVGFPTNVAFAIIKPLSDRRRREDFFAFADNRFHMFPWFGLVAVRPMMIGGENGGMEDKEVVFLYASMRETRNYERPIFGFRPVGKPYRKLLRLDGVMQLVFMERVTAPISERCDTNSAIVVDGRVQKTTFETARQDLRIDKETFDDIFSTQVYMRCDCGPFGVADETARKIVAHDAPDAEPRARREICEIDRLAFLDGREISEVVYWLWRRKGKTEEYGDFVKAHPELFEPIADVGEFKTELGKRLLGGGK